MTADNHAKTQRLGEIRAWRARFYVHPDLAGLPRNHELESESGQVAVFQHTLDDYDFLLQLIAESGDWPGSADNEVKPNA